MDGYALHRVLRTGLRLLRDVVLGGLRRLGWSALGGAPVGLWIGTQEGAVVGLAAFALVTAVIFGLWTGLIELFH